MADDEGAAGGPAAAQAFELTAEWALWGKQGADTTYRVLAHSHDTLTMGDFAGVIQRYTPGTPDRLPQYSVFWVPGSADATGFVSIAIHEHALYAQQDGRDHYDASGREIVFIRLFCARYADLAEHGVTFTRLLTAVQGQDLPPQNPIAPVTLRFAAEQAPPPRPADGFAAELAEVVAALLLTTSPVCVLGAEEVPAPGRLAFIDDVLSLLPYGLRATLSASTWVSPTAQDLKFRLFFASVRRDDEQTHHVRWEQPSPAGHPEPGSEAARRYQDWLRGRGARARSLLAAETAPLRFSDAHIDQLVAALPRDLTVADTLEDLAVSLSEGDTSSAKTEVQRLERQLANPVEPADRDHYHSQVVRHRLLGHHPRLSPGVQARVYRVLLGLAFEAPLSYLSYCEVEDCADGPPRGPLRSELLQLSMASYVPWLLTAKAEPRVSDEELMTTLNEQGVPATSPLEELQRDVTTMRPAHRAIVYDFAVHYLCTYAKAPGEELARLGYLTATLEAVFPGDQRAQRNRLENTLRLVHGGALSRGQIRDLFSERDLQPTAAFEAAVARLASSPKATQLIKEQAAYARAEHAKHGEKDVEHGDGLQADRRTHRWRLFIRRRRDAASPGDIIH